MNIKLKKLLFGTLILVLATGLASETAFAQKAKKKEDEANQIDSQTGTVLTKAIEFLNNNNIKEARAKLSELKMDRLSPHEKAVVEQMLVNMDMSEEKYASARTHMQAAIDSGGLNDQEVSTIRYQIAQSWVVEEKWAEGAKGIEDWLKTAKSPNGSVYYLLAACYYNLDKIDQALPNIRKAVELSDKPVEAWVQMYASLLIQKEQYKDARPIVEKLVNSYPAKKLYWLQLSQIYYAMDDAKNALIVLQLAHDAGLLTEPNELQNLASMTYNADMPYAAATVITKAIDDKKITPDVKTWQFLASAYSAAKEFKKAIPMIEKAAVVAENGREYMRLGDVNNQLSQWDAAVEAFKKALAKGGLQDVADAQIKLGYALFQQKKYTEAKEWFEKAQTSPAHAKNAKNFIALINSKLK